jgi:hypothetical protein
MPGQDPRAAQPEDQEQHIVPAPPARAGGSRDPELGAGAARKPEEWEGYSAAVLNDLLDG